VPYRNNNLYIYKASLLDLVTIVIKSFTSRVVVWRSRAPKPIEKICNSINPFDLMNKDDWLKNQNSAFVKWEENVAEIYERIDGVVRCCGINIDYKKNLMQAVSIDLQNFLIFAEAARLDSRNNNIDNYAVVPSPLLLNVIGRDVLCKFIDEDNLSFSRFFLFRYYINNYLDIYLRFIVEITRLFKTLFAKRVIKSDKAIPVIWAGTTPREMPSIDNRLNYSWAVECGAIRTDNVLYLLPVKPSYEQENFSKENNLCTIVRHDLVSLLDFNEKLSIIYSLFVLAFSSFRAVFNPQDFKKIEYALGSIKWIWIVKKLNAKTYLGSSSVSWPEQPEVAVMNALGVRTITWMYSANTIGYSSESCDFNDDGLERSTLVSKEYWVWSGAVKKYLLNRTRSDIYFETGISVVGPMMCGNPRYLQMASVDIRNIMGINKGGFYIGIFDVTIHSPEWMSKYASSYLGDSKESLDAFYKGVLSILNVSPDIKLLIKPKRKNDLNLVCDEYLKLTDEDNKFVRDGRVILLDPYMDPYMPIAAADACIGMPFTSPVLAALSEDRNGIYYDPCYTARYPAEPEYKDILVHKEDMLLELVKKWSNSKYQSRSNELILSIPPAGLYENICQQLIKCY